MHPPRLSLLALLTLPLLLPAPPVRADCATGECIPGGGNSRTDARGALIMALCACSGRSG